MSVCVCVCVCVCVYALFLNVDSHLDMTVCVVLRSLALHHNVASSAEIEYCSIPAWWHVASRCGALHTRLMFTSLRSHVTQHNAAQCVVLHQDVNQPLLLNTHIHLHISHATGGYNVHR